ncbi:MAG: hypothetical protein H6574_07880 [Lewinellaceae bacterium]|nr:hypothetical protein [Saprospiraceae bacterium]MCB9330984.1 hypothetical protein [Lewinellaceae bacterium]
MVSRIMHLLPGPEIFWAVIYLVVMLLAQRNTPPTKSMDDFLENLFLYVPLVTALLFGLWYIQAIEKTGLLLRVWVAGIFGGHFVLDKGLGAHSQQGPGIGTAYIIGMLLVFFVLICGSIFVKIRF